jgi:hypothetical protein
MKLQINKLEKDKLGRKSSTTHDNINESLYSNLSQYSQVKYLSLNSYKYEISDLPGLFKI